MPLGRLFDTARKKLGDRKLLEELRDHFLIKEYDPWYSHLTRYFWHRIYTTNIDDLLEKVFVSSLNYRLHTINGINQDYLDRDELLHEVQYVKLNGSITAGSLELVTFGNRQYATRSNLHEPWYDHFVRDYAQMTTVILGSRLDEPLFYQAIQSRQSRRGSDIEKRLKSFFVSPNVSPAIVDDFREFNVTPVKATGKEFFEWLAVAVGDVPPRDQILVQNRPDLISAVSPHTAFSSRDEHDQFERFLMCFILVKPGEVPKDYRSFYLLGSQPTWNDMYANLDASRDLSEKIKTSLGDYADSGNSIGPLLIAGHRGSGKTTILLRAALEAHSTGHLCYVWDVSKPLDVDSIIIALKYLNRKLVLFFDDVDNITFEIKELVERSAALAHPPKIVTTLRSNSIHIITSDRAVKCETMEVGALSDREITSVIHVLRRENRLGRVTGQTDSAIADLFRRRAKKQLLVAMKEVTASDSFDNIVRNEFYDFADRELQAVYCAVCIVSSYGMGVTKNQILSISNDAPVRILEKMEREYRELIVPTFAGNYAARHPYIAEVVVEEIAERGILAEAYLRLLQTISNDLNPGDYVRKTYLFRLYARVINHKEIYRRFEKNIDEARGIYDSIQTRFSEDGHYWLQYGTLEMYFGELSLAEHYLSSALALRPMDYMIRHAMAHLRMLKALRAETPQGARLLLAEAIDDLRILMDEGRSPHPWHTTVLLGFHWHMKWERDKKKLKKELEELSSTAERAMGMFPGSGELEEAYDAIKRGYLELGLNRV